MRSTATKKEYKINMRSDEAARLLGIPYNDPAREFEEYLGDLGPDSSGEDVDIHTILSAKEQWAREFERKLNAQNEPLPEHEPSATPVTMEFRPAGPGDLNHNFQD
ncbi:hypothetical protein IU429_17690 [Nocardia elegans]|uniref:hypothetical protein n=1 Tax=Nocardia elegans TaxID=300029 RepID=UPI00189503E9|nr:hypothetical protein [Nocardia elegans]MBF6449506.1 hypothetical protein [Nocardia elegans]